MEAGDELTSITGLTFCLQLLHGWRRHSWGQNTERKPLELFRPSEGLPACSHVPQCFAPIATASVRSVLNVQTLSFQHVPEPADARGPLRIKANPCPNFSARVDKNTDPSEPAQVGAHGVGPETSASRRTPPPPRRKSGKGQEGKSSAGLNGGTRTSLL